MSLKLSFFYNIVCPRSWIFYQVLQKKLIRWRDHRQFVIEYLPVNSTFLHKEIYGVHPADLIPRKKDYMLHELNDICDFYGLKKGNFDVTYAMCDRMSRTAALLLNLLRRTRPEDYQMFLERIFHDFWHNMRHFTHTSHYFELGRQLGVPFGEMDKIIMHLENKENILDMGNRNLHLLIEERIKNIPWLRVDSIPGNQKLIGFTEIMRLELMDELMEQSSFNPLNHTIGNPLFYFPNKDNEMNKISTILEATTDNTDSDLHKKFHNERKQQRLFSTADST